MAVDADHHLSLAATQDVGHPLVVLERKVHAVAGSLPVRRIHVMEGMGSIVAFGAFKPREILNVGARQALPSSQEVSLDPQQIYGRSGGRLTERLPADLAGEGMVLQVEESGGALYVRKCFGADHPLPFEHLSRTERSFELAHEFFQVVLDDAIQSHQVAVDVVEDFNLSGLRPHEVKRGTASEDLDLAFVRRKKRNEAIGEAEFATHPRDDGCRHL